MKIYNHPNMTTHLSILLVTTFFAAFLASNTSPCAAVFLSIDCGSSETHTDTNSIKWVGDGPYIDAGFSDVVNFGSSVAQVMSTLRVFTSRKKNCYTINEVSSGEKVLVRASFFFGGGYDTVSYAAPAPTFDLLYDGNYWATVNTTDFEVVSYEAIYVVKGNSTSICVAQTNPGQFPFMSALEIRSLDPEMYSVVGSDSALVLTWRASFTSNETTIRYPADPYDRIWVPAYIIGASDVKNEALAIDVSGAKNKPPVAVFKEASEAISIYDSMILYTKLPETSEAPTYLTFYFSEIQRLKMSDKRSFQLKVNNRSFSDPIVPPFGGVAEAFIANISASSNTSVTLEPTSDSTLPVLINAMEIYTVRDKATVGTHFKDVDGLAALRSGYGVLLSWTGDPCLPSRYAWDWVECSYDDASPRVIALYLSSFELVGPLPDFSSMDALQKIDLHNNSIDGYIPNFLGSLPNLQELNLADNRFNGTVPTSLSSNKNLKLDVTGNCFSGTNTTCKPSVTSTTSSSGSSKLKLPITIVIGATIQLLGFLIMCC